MNMPRMWTALIDGAIDLATIGAGLTILAIWVDALVIDIVHGCLTPALDTFFDRVSALANGAFFATAALGLYGASLVMPRLQALRPWGPLCQRVRQGSLLMLLTLLTGGLITWLLKQVVARARPLWQLEHGVDSFAEAFSGFPFNAFPSSHAFTAFAVAGVLGHLRPAWRTPLLVLAIVTSACRVLTLEHFPSDVLASAFVAAWCVRFWVSRLPQALDQRS